MHMHLFLLSITLIDNALPVIVVLTHPLLSLLTPVNTQSYYILIQAMNKSSKMLNYVNFRMRVTIQDKRVLVGTFLAFDR